MRLAEHLIRVGILAFVGMPVGLHDTAVAASPRWQAGAGLSLSVLLGDLEKRRLERGRVGMRLHTFAEAEPTGNREGVVEGVTLGAEVGMRLIPGAETRFEVLGRVGGGWVHQPTGGWRSHANVAVLRAIGGVSLGTAGVPSGIAGADLRGPGLYLRALHASPVRRHERLRRDFTFVEAGTEVGFVPHRWGAWVDGRPLRDAAGERHPGVYGSGSAPERAKGWLKSGRDELEAVSAFLNLAAELQALGAPKSLIGRCLDAADDEAVHALLCFGRASELGAGPILARPLRPMPRRGLDRRAWLAALGQESMEDGFVNEGRAAMALLRQASATRSNRDALIWERIAAEESTHSQLGWDVAQWCAA